MLRAPKMLCVLCVLKSLHYNSQTLGKPCLLTVRVTTATFVSRTSLVNGEPSHRCDKLTPDTCLTQQFAIWSGCLILLIASYP